MRARVCNDCGKIARATRCTDCQRAHDKARNQARRQARGQALRPLRQDIMRNQRPSGPICGCGATQILCECLRDMESRPCCWACDHTDLPPDIRPETHVASD